MPITTMAELDAELTRLTDGFRAQQSRLGYFSALYTTMTRHVRAGVESGRFHDNVHMEQLACHFAGRYLHALDSFQTGQRAPLCWDVAFRTASRWRPVILQHLLVGMNAHINFDLGIAAAEVADTLPGGLASLHDDFLEINDLLAELVAVVQTRIGLVSPWMRVLDWVGGRTEDRIINFSMDRARDAAWGVAQAFAPLAPEDRLRAAAILDAEFALFARCILKPGRKITIAMLPARLREDQNVAHVINALQGNPIS